MDPTAHSNSQVEEVSTFQQSGGTVLNNWVQVIKKFVTGMCLKTDQVGNKLLNSPGERVLTNVSLCCVQVTGTTGCNER